MEFFITIFLWVPLLHRGEQGQMESNRDRRRTKRTENKEETACMPSLCMYSQGKQSLTSDLWAMQ